MCQERADAAAFFVHEDSGSAPDGLKRQNTGIGSRCLKIFEISQKERLALNAQQDLADLANAVKHVRLNYPTKTDAQPKLAHRDMSITGRSPIIILKANIEHNGVTIDVFDLATKCIAAWNVYLSSQP